MTFGQGINKKVIYQAKKKKNCQISARSFRMKTDGSIYCNLHQFQEKLNHTRSKFRQQQWKLIFCQISQTFIKMLIFMKFSRLSHEFHTIFITDFGVKSIFPY